ncbi:MAG: reverse transcriptase-like protein [Lachnospiraceae bacterium]|nr:reverse transcriptase-like protein [Lachnospiraceae bacterium]
MKNFERAGDARLVAYVDGSYSHELQKYAFGCVLFLPDGRVIEKYGSGDNPDSLAIRNVAGEMIGAMFAVKWALVNGFGHVEVRHDYTGIAHWALGTWKAKTPLTQKYAQAMGEWMGRIRVTFTKVAAHSHDTYNDTADALAKSALTQGAGVPPIRREV